MTALAAGAVVYYMQEYGPYAAVSFTPGAEIVLTALSGTPEPIPVRDIQGIDGNSSPLKFRACFVTEQSLATLTETYRVYEAPTPLNAPGWFDCFDADRIGEALDSGEAVAFLSQANVVPNSNDVEIDRVVAVFPDGRAFAWNQLAPGTEK
nr:DUF6446 family protein [Stagnihabitans tardus]